MLYRDSVEGPPAVRLRDDLGDFGSDNALIGFVLQVGNAFFSGRIVPYGAEEQGYGSGAGRTDMAEQHIRIDGVGGYQQQIVSSGLFS